MAADISAWDKAGLQYSIEDNVAWLRLNRPQKRNAMDRPLRNAILEAIHDLTEDPEVRAAVITGNGVAFSSGADLTQPGGPHEVPPERARGGAVGTHDDALLYGWYRIMDGIWRSNKVFIAGVNGVAAGGGCQLALGCDFIIASEKAQFWEVFVKRGLPLEAGGAWILPRLTSLVRAKEIALLGEPLSGADAERFGMVNRCVPEAEFDATLREWAKKVATAHTVRLGHIKGQLNASLESTRHQTFREEGVMLALGGGEDSAEAMAAYRERREPKFSGR